MTYETPSEQPPGGPAYAVPNSNLALVSLITGILGLTIFPIIGSIIAIITGVMGRNEIRESAGSLGGDGMALAGLIMGFVGIGLAVIGLCIGGVFIALPLCFLLAEGDLTFVPNLIALLH